MFVRCKAKCPTRILFWPICVSLPSLSPLSASLFNFLFTPTSSPGLFPQKMGGRPTHFSREKPWERSCSHHPQPFLTQATFSLKQLPFKFFNVHWEYVNYNATKYFRKITFYKLNCLYFCPMYGKQFKICCGLPVYASEICM